MKRCFFAYALIIALIFPIFETTLLAQLFPELEVDLEKRQFDKRLPFDTPFRLIVKLDAEQMKVLKELCVEWKETSENSTNKQCGEKIGKYAVRINIPALEAARNYRFCFQITRSQTPSEKKKFRKDAFDSIDSFLKRKEIINEIFNEQTSQVRDYIDVDGIIGKLASKFPKLIKLEDNMRIPDSSILYRIDVLKKEIEKIIGFLDPQIEKYIRISTFKSKKKKLHESLKNFMGDEKLQAISAIILGAKKRWWYLLKAAVFTDKLKDLDCKVLGQIVSGHRSIAKDLQKNPLQILELKDHWKPEDCDYRIKNLDTLHRELKTIRFLIKRVSSKDFNEEFVKIDPMLTIKNLGPLKGKIQGSIDLTWRLLEQLYHLQEQLTLRRKKIGVLVNQINKIVTEEISIDDTSWQDFVTRSSWYISADAGVAYAPILKEAFPYVGVNIYFRPINKQVPLSLLKEITEHKSTFCHRFSAMVGISLSSLAKDGERKNLFGKTALLLGAGYRFTDAFRISTGALFFKAIDPNPLISAKQIELSWFVSISLDWDIRTTLGGLGRIFK